MKLHNDDRITDSTEDFDFKINSSYKMGKLLKMKPTLYNVDVVELQI